MGVDLMLIGRHSIPFKDKKIESKSNLINLLNSLKLEDSEFLKEACKLWFSPNKRYKQYLKGEAYEIYKKESEQSLEHSLNTLSWKFEEYEDEDSFFETEHYVLVGPYGLELEINKYFFEISIWIGRYHLWFNTYDDYDILWREKWRLIVYKITNKLGGKYMLYFPDNMSDLDIYQPRNYFFPKEMEEYLQVEIKDLDQLIEVISDRYAKPLTLIEADKIYNILEKHPFVIDKFYDLDKTLSL